jgi:ELWxxDGT repeat protein
VNAVARLASHKGVLYERLAAFPARSLVLGSAARARSCIPGSNVGPQLRTDIEPFGTEPREFVRSGIFVFFTAWDLRHGREVWRTDGTAEGTALVKDIWPGGWGEPFGLTDVGGTLLFTANDGVHGWELWRSDGTTPGTTLVEDLYPGQESGFPGWYSVQNDVLFFSADDGPSRQLWRSDGSKQGTVRLTEDDGSGASSLTFVGDTLFFTRNTSQIWRSDGTPAGTTLVKDLRPGWSTILGGLTSFKGALFFVGDDGISGPALWRSDGTEAGTQLVKAVAIYHYQQRLVPFNDKLYFFANDTVYGYELWHSDGTEGGTTLLKDINPGAGHARDTEAEPQFAPSADKLYFVADDGTHGYELWKTRGSESSTMLVKDINPGMADGGVHELTDLHGMLYFGGSDGGDRQGLWRSDSRGTELVKDLGYLSSMQAIDRQLFFAASDNRSGIEPWTSDGTTTGTALLEDLERGGNSDPSELTPFNGALFFTADDGETGRNLWRSDGTAEGTQRLLDVAPGDEQAVVYGLTPAGQQLFFGATVVGTETSTSSLWVSDGTPGGTDELLRGLEPSALRAVGDKLFFVTGNDSSEPHLWISDGTTEGTLAITTFGPAQDELHLHPWVAEDSMLFLTLHDHEGGTTLWRSDGTSDGTNQVVLGTEFDDLDGLTLLNSGLFFVAGYDDGYDGVELWKLDLLTGEVTRLKRFVDGFTSVSIYSLIPVGDQLLFGVEAPDTPELWRSDGTPDGTVAINAIDQPEGGYILGASAVEGALLFAFGRFQTDAVLWRSDGSDEGTVPLAPIGAGPGEDAITQVWPDGQALFAGSTGLSGFELWQTDGTAPGTRIAFDLVAGSESSNPADFTVVGDTVYFTAAEGEHGRELWALDRGLFNHPPVASALSFSVGVDGTIQGLLNGRDVDSQPLQYHIISEPAKGRLTLNDPATGAFSYTPAAGSGGADRFTYAVSDGWSESSPATVTLWLGDMALHNSLLYVPLLSR